MTPTPAVQDGHRRGVVEHECSGQCLRCVVIVCVLLLLLLSLLLLMMLKLEVLLFQSVRQ